MELLEHLETPRTVRELGELVGKPADRLYYHLKLLRQHALVVELPGKRFECAGSIAVRSGAVTSKATAHQLTGDLLDRVSRDMDRSIESHTGELPMMVGLKLAHLTPTRREELMRQLEALLEEFE